MTLDLKGKGFPQLQDPRVVVQCLSTTNGNVDFSFFTDKQTIMYSLSLYISSMGWVLGGIRK